MTIRHKFKVRGHWWFDAGIVGFYLIARDLLLRREAGPSGQLLWSNVKVGLERDGVVIEAPEERMKPFVEACYEELAARWWNRSKAEQGERLELVCYDRKKEEFYLAPKRMPTPIPALSMSPKGWHVEGDAIDSLPPSLQTKVRAYLEEQKKSLWGKGELLCYGLPVCHPILEIFPTGGRKKVCSICGQTLQCDSVNQTSFPLFASQSATFTFDSDLKAPDTICWECQLLGKFAVQSAFYKKVDDLIYILQFESGDMEELLGAHEEFGAESRLVLPWADNKVYFSNFQTEKGSVLMNARLTYEVLWGLYLEAYKLVLENQKERHRRAKELLAKDEEELDGESLRRIAALNVILMSLASKGKTFITKEVVSYTDTTYLFRLIGYIRKCIRHEASEAVRRDGAHFFDFLFFDLQFPNPQKPYDPLNGLDRNRILQRIFEKKSILHHVENFVFEKSLQTEYPWLGRILFFVIRYELAVHHRDLPEGDGNGMTEEQITLATKLGAQIVISAREILMKEGESSDLLKGIKGDLFTLRKTRTATDFLEQLNRLQFRYGIVVNKEIASGILAKSEVPFEEFKAYCMISALNAYNSAMYPYAAKDKTEGN